MTGRQTDTQTDTLLTVCEECIVSECRVSERKRTESREQREVLSHDQAYLLKQSLALNITSRQANTACLFFSFLSQAIP